MATRREKIIYSISAIAFLVGIVMLVLAFTVFAPKTEVVTSGYTCRQQKISQDAAVKQWDAVATSNLPNRHYQLFYPSVQEYTPYTTQEACQTSIATFDSAQYQVALPGIVTAAYV